MQVFIPTLLFCLLTQWLGLYVASFLLVAGFMRFVGRIALWKSLLTAFVFAAIMFVTFDLAFDVIMPKGPARSGLLRTVTRPARWKRSSLLLHGFSVLLTWKILALMMVGLVLGIFVGVLPGLGGPNGVAILLPLTFTMDPTSAIVMLSCIYWGALFGGAITSILFNIPGEAWSVATTFDGYPMAQQGKAAEALTAAFTSSFIGSLVGGPADHVPGARHRLVRAAVRAAGILRGLPADVLLVRRPRTRGQAQDHHLHGARPAARRHRHGYGLRHRCA